MFPNLRIIMQASTIEPMQICYVETESATEKWVHICLVHQQSDGYILLLDHAQLPIDFEGEITYLWGVPDGDSESRIATMGSYKMIYGDGKS